MVISLSHTLRGNLVADMRGPKNLQMPPQERATLISLLTFVECTEAIGKGYFEIKLYQNLTVKLKMDERTMATKPPGNCIHNNGGRRRHHFLGAIFWRARLTQAQRPFTA